MNRKQCQATSTFWRILLFRAWNRHTGRLLWRCKSVIKTTKWLLASTCLGMSWLEQANWYSSSAYLCYIRSNKILPKFVSARVSYIDLKMSHMRPFGILELRSLYQVECNVRDGRVVTRKSIWILPWDWNGLRAYAILTGDKATYWWGLHSAKRRYTLPSSFPTHRWMYARPYHPVIPLNKSRRGTEAIYWTYKFDDGYSFTNNGLT